MIHAHALLDEAEVHGFPTLVVDALELLAVTASSRRAAALANRVLDATLAERDRLGYRMVMHAPRAERDELVATTRRTARPPTMADVIALTRLGR